MKYAFYRNLIAEKDKLIHFIGGGGKSTLMHRIGRDCLQQDRKVILTSYYPFLTPFESTVVFIKDIKANKLHIKNELDKKRLIYLSKGYQKTHLLPLTEKDMTSILKTIAIDHLFIEDDYVQGRSLSDYQALTAVNGYQIDRYVNVLGADAFNQEKNDSWLKTKNQFWKKRSFLTPINLAAWLRKHPLLVKIQKKNIPITVFINKVENIFVENLSIPLAKSLKLRGLDRVFIGSVYNSTIFEVKE